MPTTRIKFTKRALEAVPAAAAGKRETLLDTECPALAIRVTDKGVKSFILQRRVNGKPTFVTLGRFPEMTVEQARKAAAFVAARYTPVAIYSSPLQRCRDSARELADRLSLTVDAREGLTDTDYGLWQGRLASDIAREDASRYAQWQDDNWKLIQARCLGVANIMPSPVVRGVLPRAATHHELRSFCSACCRSEMTVSSAGFR